ncbi:MAG: ATPase domain-containing protein [Candidatus Bathyarchaeota archaeon]|jgi:DNA repair protein RadB|nr:ATPase domain-containing protein [Candidatus Bathyarchaeota archaeon]
MERRLPTGLSQLDDLLGGGFRYGSVSLIYGEASTGKTTIAFTSLVRHLERDPWAKAYYIDSDNKLSTRRLTQITKDPKTLERLLIWRSMSFHEQGRTIESLSDLLHNGNIPIVVDSITGPYRLETGRSERTFRSNKELNRQLGFLSETAKIKDSAILVTGQVHSILDRDPPEVEPVAQRLLRYWSDTILKLETTSMQGVRQAILKKPGDEQRSCRFKLGETGIEEA